MKSATKQIFSSFRPSSSSPTVPKKMSAMKVPLTKFYGCNAPTDNHLTDYVNENQIWRYNTHAHNSGAQGLVATLYTWTEKHKWRDVIVNVWVSRCVVCVYAWGEKLVDKRQTINVENLWICENVLKLPWWFMLGRWRANHSLTNEKFTVRTHIFPSYSNRAVSVSSICNRRQCEHITIELN